MKPTTRLFVALFGALLLVASCVDGESPLSPDDLVTVVPLPVYAALNASAADDAAQPINRIRAVAERVPDGEVLGSTVLDVSPTAESWEVSIDVAVPGSGAQVVVYLELIHVDASGRETVEFSGRTSPISVTVGGVSRPAEVEVVRGPADNFSVTGIEISEALATLMGGSSGPLAANVTTGEPASPMVFWTVLNPTVLDVSGTMVTGLRPGTGRVVATAGAFSDTVTIEVVPRPASVVVSPDTLRLPGAGAEGSFSATVLDPRGDPLSGVDVLWRSLDPSVAESLGDGDFRALSAGEGLVEAIVAADTTVRATGVLVVEAVSVDLGVEKTVSTGFADVGDTLEFTVVARNNDVVAVDGVTVRDSLPDGLDFVSAAVSSGTFDPSTGVWSVGTLLGSGSATMTLTVVVTEAGADRVLTNAATVQPGPGLFDVDPGNDRATASVVVGALTSDLGISKTVEMDPVQEGDTIRFTLAVSNLGPANAPLVYVEDQLPPDVILVGTEPGVGTYDEASGTWSHQLSLDAGVTSTFVLKAIGGPSSVGLVENVATVRHGSELPDPDPDNNSSSVSFEIIASGPRADVSVSKSVDVSTPTEGELVTFTLTVTNLGPDAATNILLEDILPTGLTLDLEQVSSGVAALGSGQYSVATLASGASEGITLEAFVDAGTSGTTITNAFRVVSADQYDPAPENNTSLALVSVDAGPLNVGITKSVDLATITEGETVTFTVTAENFGPGDATGVSLWDSIPEPLVFVSATTTVGTYDDATHIWDIGSIADGEFETLTVVAQAPDGSGGTTPLNDVYVYSLDQPDSEYSDDQASVTVTVQARQLDIEVIKEVDDPVPVELAPVVFTIKVVNHGPGPATNIAILDTLTAPLQVDGYSASVGSIVGDSLWLIPMLAEDDTATLDVMMTVEVGAAGSVIRNLAQLDTLDQIDIDGDNDQSLVQITVPLDLPPTVTITGPVDGSSFDPGDPVTFVATASDPEDGDLTSSIQWYSDQDGLIGTGGRFTSTTLSAGPHRISAEVTDAVGTTVFDEIGVIIAIVTTPTTLNVPYGGTASLPISLSAPAPVGGLDLVVTSAAPGITDPVVASLTIPEGALSANATMQGVLPGTTDVTVASVGFGSSTTTVSVTASLNVIQSTLSLPQTFTSDIDIRLESESTPIAAPTGGLVVTLTSTNPSCVAAPASVSIPSGLTSQTATISWGGVTTTPCSAWVRATAPSIAPDSVNVTIQVPPAISLSGVTVGSGLQYGNLQANLGFGSRFHGGVTVRIQSADPATLLVSPNASTAGTEFFDAFVPDGQYIVNYYVHGLEGITAATVAVSASAPRFTTGTVDIAVVQPALDVVGLGISPTTFAGDDPFYARVGVTLPGYGGLWSNQAVRIGGSPVTATFTSSDGAVGDLVVTAGAATTVTADILPGGFNTPTSVAAGGVAFSPIGGGTTTVAASIPGFISTSNAEHDVTVTAPTISVGSGTVGSGLQYGNLQANLGFGSRFHGGVTVRIQSADRATLLVSPDAATEGTEFIDVVLADGQYVANYYVHGVEGITSATATVSAAAPGFTTGSADIDVVQPAVELVGLTTSTNTFAADDPFYARVGVTLPGYAGLWSNQAVRIGGNTVTATITSSDGAVGDLVTTSGSATSVDIDITPGGFSTPTSVAAGGVAFDAIGGGTTTVTASIPGFISTDNADHDVAVSAPTISLSSFTVGSGLQYGALQANLGFSSRFHGGVTVRIQSADPATLLISPNSATEGTEFIDVALADGQYLASYYVQGVEGITAATVTVSASAPGFTAGTADFDVVQPAVDIVGLTTSMTTFAADDPFYARVGVTLPGYSGLWSNQAVRIGGSTVTATITSSFSGVGVLRTTSGSATTVDIDIPPGDFYTPTTVAAGGVAFDPLGSGTTTVAAAIPGFVATDNADYDVTVSAPAISVGNVTVGGGLQYGAQVNLGFASRFHGGVTVRITSSSGAVMQVSPDAATVGADFIDVAVADGQYVANFFVQGVEGATGTPTLTVTAPGFTDGSGTVTVVQPALDIIGLNTTTTAGAADDAFQVRTGVAFSPPSGLWIEQAIRFGGSTVTATVTSSDVGAGQLVTTATTGSPVTVDIVAGSARSANSVAAGGVAHDPLVAGSTTIAATIPGFIQTTVGSRVVTINP